MAIQVITKEFSSSSVQSISGANQMEIGPRLNADLIAAGSVTYVDSSYTVFEKGDVSSLVVYSDSGTQELRAQEFYDARSFYGSDAFSVSSTYAVGTYGEPKVSKSYKTFVGRINDWLQDNNNGRYATITIKDVHFRIDATGQKRVLFIYDSNYGTTIRYFARLYEQSSDQAGLKGDGPLVNFDSDTQLIQGTTTLATTQFVNLEVDNSGRRYVLAIFGITV